MDLSHVKFERSAHAREAMHEKIRHLMSLGVGSLYLMRYFGIKSDITMMTEIKLATNSKSWEEARFKVLGERMISLVLEGYLTPKDLDPFFPFMSATDIFNFLAQFNPSYVTCLVSKIFIEDPSFIRKFTYEALGERLGVKKSTISNWVHNKIWMSIDPNTHGFDWGGREKILFECYWRPMARLKVGKTGTKTGLLLSIGWSGGDIDVKMSCLFYETGVGVSNQDFYSSAKHVYSGYTLQDLDAWFIRKCEYFTHLRLGHKVIDLMHFEALRNLFFT